MRVEASPRITEPAAAPTGRHLLRPLRTHPLPAAILVLKLLLGTFLGSHFLYLLFVPFLNLAAGGALNPWQAALDAGIPNAFPYGPVMYYILAVPRFLLSWALPAGTLTATPLHYLAVRLPLLAADAAILLLLLRLDTNIHRLFRMWWASPIVLYITFVHGQLDLIPTAFLMGSIVLLVQGRPSWSAVLLGLGLATKSHLFVALPFLAVYSARRESSWLHAARFGALSLAAYVASLLPWVLSPAFRTMVFGTAEQGRLFQVSIEFLPSLKVYIAPLAVGLLFLQFSSYKKMSRDMLLMFLGLAFTALVTVMPPAHGYYLWPLPFVVYFFSQQTVYPRLAMWMFNGTALAYLMLGADSTLFESLRLLLPGASSWPTPTQWAAARGIDPVSLNSALYTSVEISLLAIAFMMYRHGVNTNIIYRNRTRPTLIGIGGDSGSGKHTTRDLLAEVLGTDNLLTVNGDDVHKWERGHEMWKVVSHLNPGANDLYLLAEHAHALGRGHTITKVHYDHTSGKFTKPSRVYPGKYIFVVGLHPFYLKKMRDLIDIKIYMDPDEELRLHWKTERDMRDRGYSREQVQQQLQARAADATRFIHPQKQFADLLIQYYRPPDNPTSSLGIRIRADNSLPFGPLRDHLELAGFRATLTPEEDLVHQTLSVEGEAGADAIQAAASALMPHLPEFTAPTPRWREGVQGVLQICVLVQLSEHMRNTQDRNG